MTVRLLALDLDGTLFADDLVVSERTREAIRAAQARGVLVTLATGRMFTSARKIAGDLGMDVPLICYQGALVRHSGTGEVLYHKTVPLALTHEIIAATARRGLHLNVYLDDRLYVAQMTEGALYYSQINYGLELNQVGDLHAWLDAQGGGEPTKLVIVTPQEQTDAVLAEFTAEYGERLQVTKSHPRFTEFTNIECSKGRALAFLAAHLGVRREVVMAIGDGHNDLDMLAWAGYGLAMPTAPQAVLDVAHSICLPLHEDGAAEAIERLILSVGLPGK
ncbi:MAG TPA: Cof-type HAD-IIB family hydrolase [Chloroflexia bacterium]|nr:Cof-type HAD-IIB family hydrolase [Chloroflexia bacterium]